MTAEILTRGEQTREQILQAAYLLFLRQGYHGTSMRQIAEGAGIALGGIYNHFPGKESIFVANLAANHPIHKILPSLSSAQGASVEELVRDAANQMTAVLEKDRDFLNLVFIELVEFDGQHFPEIIANLLPLAMEFMQRLKLAEGEVRPFPPMIILRSFIGLFFSYVFTGMLLGKQFQNQMTDHALDAFVDIYLHGILGKEG